MTKAFFAVLMRVFFSLTTAGSGKGETIPRMQEMTSNQHYKSREFHITAWSEAMCSGITRHFILLLLERLKRNLREGWNNERPCILSLFRIASKKTKSCYTTKRLFSGSEHITQHHPYMVWQRLHGSRQQDPTRPGGPLQIGCVCGLHHQLASVCWGYKNINTTITAAIS